MSDDLLYEKRDRVAWLTINRESRRNAISQEMITAFLDHLQSADTDEDIRTVCITAAGEKIFCSGADLSSDFGSRATAAQHHEAMQRVGSAARTLHRLPKPTLAAVDGVAVGAGMNLALACDVAIASDRVRFSEIFVRRGLTVDFGGTWLLPRRVGSARAKELALTGRMVGAEEALRYGLVADVVPAERLAERAHETALALAAGAPLAQRFIKEGFDRAFEMTFDQALSFEAQAQSICLASEDVIEGVRAFLEKRDPHFGGR